MSEPLPKGWLPKAEFDAIYSRVPRLTVEVVIADHRGVLLSLRDIEPCRGLWHMPGGTVLWAERLVDTVARIARAELGIEVCAGEMLGYLQYPSHYENGLDCPVGIAFAAAPVTPLPDRLDALTGECAWFTEPPAEIHAEQVEFLRHIGVWGSAASPGGL